MCITAVKQISRYHAQDPTKFWQPQCPPEAGISACPIEQFGELPFVPGWNGVQISEFQMQEANWSSDMDGRLEARIFGLSITAVYVCLLLAALASA